MMSGALGLENASCITRPMLTVTLVSPAAPNASPDKLYRKRPAASSCAALVAAKYEPLAASSTSLAEIKPASAVCKSVRIALNLPRTASPEGPSFSSCSSTGFMASRTAPEEMAPSADRCRFFIARPKNASAMTPSTCGPACLAAS